MSVLDAYLHNYDQIARDHVEHWRNTGRNPFQDPNVLKANKDASVHLIERFVPKGSYVLDAGCGMGDLMLCLSDYDCLGVEIAAAYIEVLDERDLDWITAQIEELPLRDEMFDAVIATDVLEHVIDIHSAVRELVRVLKPGGHIIVRVPNMEPVSWSERYQFVHLRILDEGTLRILFGLIFGCEVLETLIDGNSLHLVARK